MHALTQNHKSNFLNKKRNVSYLRSINRNNGRRTIKMSKISFVMTANMIEN